MWFSICLTCLSLPVIFCIVSKVQLGWADIPACCMLEGMTGGPKPGAVTHNDEDAMCVWLRWKAPTLCCLLLDLQTQRSNLQVDQSRPPSVLYALLFTSITPSQTQTPDGREATQRLHCHIHKKRIFQMSLITKEWMSDLVSWRWGEEVMVLLMWNEEIYLSQTQGPFLTGLHYRSGKWLI